MRRIMILAVAVAMLATACGSSSESAAADVEAAVDEVTTTSEATTTTADTSTVDTSTTTTTVVEVAPAPLPDGSGDFAGDATQLDSRFLPVAAGTYRVNSLGTPLSLTLPSDLWVQSNGFGGFVLAHPDGLGPDDRDIVFVRTTRMVDPTTPATRLEIPDAGWPGADFAGWLDAASDDIVIHDRQETMLGGRNALYAELSLTETASCALNDPCGQLASDRSFGDKYMLPGSTYRMWVVDQGEFDPLAVIAGVNRDSDRDEWFTHVSDVLSSLAFGELEPSTMQVSEGAFETALFGGVQLNLPTETAIWSQGSFGAVFPMDLPDGGFELLDNPHAADGTPLPTVDDVVASLDGQGLSSIELEGTTIGGFDTRVFELDGVQGSTPQMLTRSSTSSATWAPPPVGRLLMIDHPERGVLVITVEAYGGPAALTEVVEVGDTIFASLSFIDVE